MKLQRVSESMKSLHANLCTVLTHDSAKSFVIEVMDEYVCGPNMVYLLMPMDFANTDPGQAIDMRRFQILKCDSDGFQIQYLEVFWRPTTLNSYESLWDN